MRGLQRLCGHLHAGGHVSQLTCAFPGSASAQRPLPDSLLDRFPESPVEAHAEQVGRHGLRQGAQVLKALEVEGSDLFYRPPAQQVRRGLLRQLRDVA